MLTVVSSADCGVCGVKWCLVVTVVSMVTVVTVVSSSDCGVCCDCGV